MREAVLYLLSWIDCFQLFHHSAYLCSYNTPKLRNREMGVKLYRIILGYKSHKQLKIDCDFCKYCNDLYLSPFEHWTECETVTVKLNKHVSNNKEKYAQLNCPEK